MKAKIKTLGCRANQYDSMRMSDQLIEYGCDLVDKEDEADIIIVNSCTVTNLAERKSSQEVRRAIRKKNNNKIIIVTGCSTRTEDKKISKISGIDFLLEDYDLSKILKKTINKSGKNNQPTEKNARVRSYIKVEDGCDEGCSYCIVPKVRGSVKSRPIEEIIGEGNDLLARGAKELVLTGINLGCYAYEGNYLKNVIQKLCSIEKLERLRISSMEPQYIDDNLLEAINNEKKVCHYFHIPIQSGCNKILEGMNRKYKKEEIKGIVRSIRKYLDNVFISADIIVGFPGETKEDFIETKDFVEELNLSKLHIFRYSKRPGTVAATFDNQIQDREKKDRAKILNDISIKIFNDYAGMYIGKGSEVLIEEFKNGYCFGLTENYLKVKIFDNKKIELGDVVKVKLSSIKNNYFESIII